LSHRPEPSGRAEVDGLDIGGRHGPRFVLLLNTHKPQETISHLYKQERKADKLALLAIILLIADVSPTYSSGLLQGKRAERSDNVAEAVKPDPRISCKRHSRRVVAGVGDERAESCRVVLVQPLRIPSVIRPVRRT